MNRATPVFSHSLIFGLTKQSRNQIHKTNLKKKIKKKNHKKIKYKTFSATFFQVNALMKMPGADSLRQGNDLVAFDLIQGEGNGSGLSGYHRAWVDVMAESSG
jgi:hypothetical protein